MKENSNAELIKALRQYISKNTAIDAFYAEIQGENKETHECNLSALEEAITKGDLNALVFSHPDCTTYLLYLIEKERIDYDLGISAYFHCLALMEFTVKQPLKPEDQDLKTDANFECLKMVEEGVLTHDAKQYVSTVVENFKKIEIIIDIDLLKKEMLALHPMDQWFHVISIDKAGKGEVNAGKINFYRAILQNVPFCVRSEDWPGISSERITYVAPSLGLFRYLSEKMNPSPVFIQPAFGTIGVATLIKLHKADVHVVSLYHDRVKTNIRLVHGRRIGVYLTAFHDLAHAFMGGLLDQEDRSFALNAAPQFVDALSGIAAFCKDDVLCGYLQTIKNKLYDFDLTPLLPFAVSKTRLENYVRFAFGRGGNGTSGIYPTDKYASQPFAHYALDRLFYLVCYLYHAGLDRHNIAAMLRNQALSKHSFFNADRKEVSFRDHGIIALIDDIAKRTASTKTFFSSGLFLPNQPFQLPDVNYAAVKVLLDQGLSSRALWDAMMKDHYVGLLNLIKGLELAYFEPYVPLSASDRCKLEHHVREMLTPTWCEAKENNMCHTL